MRYSRILLTKKGGDLWCELVVKERLSGRRRVNFPGRLSLRISRPDDNGFLVSIVDGKSTIREVLIGVDSAVTLELDVYVRKPEKK